MDLITNLTDILSINLMQRSDLLERWKQEEVQPFIGWDFSYLDGRMLEEQPPWSYSSRAAKLLRQSSSVLDMGTGGGERWLSLRKFWPEKVVATEDYPPNFKLATERLAPIGVTVVKAQLTDDNAMPFVDGEFDLVLNRHSAFNSGEVGRILSPGGRFLTQQIHGKWAHDLLAAFDAKPQWPDSTLEKYIPLLQSAGFLILNKEEWSGQLRFLDVGAIVYYLKAVAWLVPGFSVKSHLQHLIKLQHQLENGGPLTFAAKKYLIEAKRKEP